LIAAAVMAVVLRWPVRRPGTSAAAWVALAAGDAGPPPPAPAPHPLDPLIAELRGASYADLRQLIARNLPRLGPPFFLRIAELSDQATSVEEKALLATFSQLMVKTLEQMYSTAERKMSEQGTMLQGLLRLCAEANGEFRLPLAPARVQRVREAIRSDLRTYATDTFVTTARAYMKKAADDKLDGVVTILQKIIQIFGAEVLRGLCCDLSGPRCPPDMLTCFNGLLDTSEDEWGPHLERAFGGDSPIIDAEQFALMLNEEVGGVLFKLPTGSAVQQVCAEFVQEILDRIKRLHAPPVEPNTPSAI
jgi:hypothetical protein